MATPLPAPETVPAARTGRPRRSRSVLATTFAAALLLAPSVASGATGDDLTSPWAFEGPGQVFCGTYTGTLVPAQTGEHSCDIAGFMIGADVDGAPTAVYSTRGDMAAGNPSATATLADFPAAGSDFGDLEDDARRVLVNYFPNQNPGLAEEYRIDGTDDQQAAAVQAALWALGGDYEMDLETEPGDPDQTDFVTFANYLHILQAVADGALPDGDEDLSVRIFGPAEGAIDSYTVGPFTVSTNAASATLDPPAGIEVVDASGAPRSLEVADGDQFYLDVPGLGDHEISATATGIEGAEVRAWATASALGAPLMPLADGSSVGVTVGESFLFTVRSVEATPARPVRTDPSFTG